MANANRDKREGPSSGKESRSRKESQDLGPSDRDSRGPQGPPSQGSSGQSDRERQGTQGQSENSPFDEDEDESE